MTRKPCTGSWGPTLSVRRACVSPNAMGRRDACREADTAADRFARWNSATLAVYRRGRRESECEV